MGPGDAGRLRGDPRRRHGAPRQVRRLVGAVLVRRVRAARDLAAAPRAARRDGGAVLGARQRLPARRGHRQEAPVQAQERPRRRDHLPRRHLRHGAPQRVRAHLRLRRAALGLEQRPQHRRQLPEHGVELRGLHHRDRGRAPGERPAVPAPLAHRRPLTDARLPLARPAQNRPGSRSSPSTRSSRSTPASTPGSPTRRAGSACSTTAASRPFGPAPPSRRTSTSPRARSCCWRCVVPSRPVPN